RDMTVQVVVSEVRFNVHVVRQNLTLTQLLSHDIGNKLWVKPCTLNIECQFSWQYGVRHINESWSLITSESTTHGALNRYVRQHLDRKSVVLGKECSIVVRGR